MSYQADVVGDSHDTADPILSVEHLSVQFAVGGQWVTAVDDVSFAVAPGETVGIVGESGSGKSVTSLAVMGLLSAPGARVTQGRVLLDGVDLLTLSERDLSRVRGMQIAMVFQEPMTSLNPAFSVGGQIAEIVRRHLRVSRSTAREIAVDYLRRVGIPDPAGQFDRYPHEFSGGMRQRVMIAMAICCHPKLLIADEPTTALDVTIQAQILDLLREMCAEFGIALLFITHSMGVVADICDRVMVMYAGQVVETAGVFELFGSPRHPYTEALLRAIPPLTPTAGSLPSVPGSPPPPGQSTPGCRFADRCSYAAPECRLGPIPLYELGPGGTCRCVRAGDGARD